ncbi:histidine phosphatase superfamily [Xylariales sp. AK1849]|nr:histidine phosphatase superfamily [Xylariales sp. AK1849]
MAPVFHLIRSAQGHHNLRNDRDMLDPVLTPTGLEQCIKLNGKFQGMPSVVTGITHFVVSPTRRSLQTCAFCMGTILKSRKMIALPELQDTGSFRAHTDRHPDILQAEWGTHVDLSRVEVGRSDETTPGSRRAAEENATRARASKALLWMRDLARQAGADAHIVVVTHRSLLGYLTGDNDGWENAECRSFHFANLHEDNTTLVEDRDNYGRLWSTARRLGFGTDENR